MTLCQLLAHQSHLHLEAGTPALLLFMLSLLKIEVRADFMPQCLSYLGLDKLLRRLTLSCLYLSCRSQDKLMETALSVLSFVSHGVKSNFWGLACPPHCGAFPASSFGLAFVLGWISGLATAVATWLYLFGFRSSPDIQVNTPSSRLSQYLHEHQLSQRRRR